MKQVLAHATHRLAFRGSWRSLVNSQRFHAGRRMALPMKPGTPIPGLDFRKDRDPPVAKERSEYPDWVDKLAEPQPTLSKLRRMPEEEATDKDKMRYLKLERRQRIKADNEERGA